jgi:hypothetical protein
MAACSSTVGATATPDAAAPGGETCAPEAQCRGCATCFDGCLCGGGTAARCAESCNSEPDAGTGPDASVAPPRYTATVVTNAFDIPPGQEFFRCQDFANPFGRDVAVLATESFMTAGSHHMFVFQKPGAQNGDLEPCSGLEFQRYLHLSQRSQQRLAYPPGVGLFFGSGNGLRVQIHYLNVSTESVHTEIAVTIRADDPQAVPVHAGQIFINTLGISVPPFSAGTADQDCTVPHDVNVFMAASHMHQHATHFISRASDGQLIYETNQWAEPAPWVFSPPRKLKAGESIHIHCDYRNDTATPLSFGESAASNEMCILAGSYYPASDGESITCLF